MNGICELYKVESDLKESHIYPKFVINHTKKTGSKHFRKIVNPNKREQDGVKLYLLSEQAEQDFSKREKWFAEQIFMPYLSGKHELNYDENLYYFAISFLWRILVLNLKTDSTIIKQWYYNLLIDAEKEWRNFLITGKLPLKNLNTNLVFTDRVKENNTDLKGVDFYLTRIMDSTIVDNEPQTCLLVYGKFNRFVFWSVLKKYGDESELKEVEINPNGGVFKIPQKLNYFPIMSFIGNRIREISQYPLPNQEQQDKIEKEILKDPKSFWNSDVGKSLYNDNFNK
jgi:LEA14-like dessication related protein